MKKKIVAILATIAAVFGFGFAANTAMAYGATGTVSGNVATFTFTGLTPGQRYVVSYDDTTVENVPLPATKYSNVPSTQSMEQAIRPVPLSLPLP